ncbi:hypothetical protein BO94DRAFT_601146, partial [Aspergillus sclerotioniger CBS 115572]
DREPRRSRFYRQIRTGARARLRWPHEKQHQLMHWWWQSMPLVRGRTNHQYTDYTRPEFEMQFNDGLRRSNRQIPRKLNQRVKSRSYIGSLISTAKASIRSYFWPVYLQMALDHSARRMSSRRSSLNTFQGMPTLKEAISFHIDIHIDAVASPQPFRNNKGGTISIINPKMLEQRRHTTIDDNLDQVLFIGSNPRRRDASEAETIISMQEGFNDGDYLNDDAYKKLIRNWYDNGSEAIPMINERPARRVLNETILQDAAGDVYFNGRCLLSTEQYLGTYMPKWPKKLVWIANETGDILFEKVNCSNSGTRITTCTFIDPVTHTKFFKTSAAKRI